MGSSFEQKIFEKRKSLDERKAKKSAEAEKQRGRR
jgi:hypothetical protein